MDGTNVDAQLALGNLMSRQNRPDAAARHFREVVRLEPKHAIARVRLSQLFAQRNQLDEAERWLRQVIDDHPDHAEAHFRLAKLASAQGKAVAAAKHYREVLRIDPNHVDTLNNLAWLLATADEPNVASHADAMRLAEKAAQITKRRSAYVLDTLAVTQAANGQFQRAIQTAQKARQLAASAKNTGVLARIDGHLRLFEQRKTVTD